MEETNSIFSSVFSTLSKETPNGVFSCEKTSDLECNLKWCVVW